MNPIQALRQNHAIEHATVAVLVKKLKPGTRLLGMATTDGFYVIGDTNSADLADSAREALARLKEGQYELAVSPFCGTNLAVTAFFAGLGSLIGMRGRKGIDRLSNVMMITLLGTIVAQPAGRLIQKYLTTSTDLASVEIGEITSKGEGTRRRHKIRTLRK